MIVEPIDTEEELRKIREMRDDMVVRCESLIEAGKTGSVRTVDQLIVMTLAMSIQLRAVAFKPKEPDQPIYEQRAIRTT
jgi:hypothetical protein